MEVNDNGLDSRSPDTTKLPRITQVHFLKQLTKHFTSVSGVSQLLRNPESNALFKTFY